MQQLTLDKETANVSVNYVKTVSMELYIQQQFEAFQRQVSPNLINKINKNLMEMLVSSKNISNKGIFDGRNPNTHQ